MLLIDSLKLYHLVFPVGDRSHSPSAGGKVASDDGMECPPSADLFFHCNRLVIAPHFDPHFLSVTGPWGLGSGKSVHPRQANDGSNLFAVELRVARDTLTSGSPEKKSAVLYQAH
jgi:hypothetical protein